MSGRPLAAAHSQCETPGLKGWKSTFECSSWVSKSGVGSSLLRDLPAHNHACTGTLICGDSRLSRESHGCRSRLAMRQVQVYRALAQALESRFHLPPILLGSPQ